MKADNTVKTNRIYVPGMYIQHNICMYYVNRLICSFIFPLIIHFAAYDLIILSFHSCAIKITLTHLLHATACIHSCKKMLKLKFLKKRLKM